MDMAKQLNDTATEIQLKEMTEQYQKEKR